MVWLHLHSIIPLYPLKGNERLLELFEYPSNSHAILKTRNGSLKPFIHAPRNVYVLFSRNFDPLDGNVVNQTKIKLEPGNQNQENPHIWYSFIFKNHCVKRVCVWSYSGPHFPTFGLNTEDTSYPSVFSPNAGKCGLE